MRWGFIAVLGGDVVSKIFTAGFAVLAIRFLPVPTFANYAYLSALVVLSYTLISGIFNRQFLMLGSEMSNERRFRNLQAVATAIPFALCIVVFHPSSAPINIASALFCVVMAAAFDFHRTATQKRQHFGSYALVEVGRTFFMLASAMAIFVLPAQLYVAVLFSAQALSYVFACFLLRLQPASDEPDRAYWLIVRGLFTRGGIWIMVYWSLVAIVGQAPMLLVAQFGDRDALAALGSAMRYYGIALSVVVAVNVVVLPRFSQNGTSEDVFRRLRESIRLLLFAGLLVIVGATLGYSLIPLVDAGKYPSAPALFVLLCLGLFPGIVMAPISSALLRLDRTSNMVVAMLAGLATTIGLALIFQSAIGTAAAAPIGGMVQLAYGLISLRRARGSAAASESREW